MKLDAWLKQDRSLEEQLRVIERLCQAVNEIHDRGEAVGALAPGRIDVDSEGRCDLSAAGKGSLRPPYVPPEGERAGPALADIYAAGVISWEILAGQPAGRAPAHLTEVRPDLSRELADAVMACVEESPEWRPNDLTYLAQMAAARRRTSGRKGAPPARAPLPPRSAPKARPRRGPSRRTWPLLAALVVVLGLGALAARQYLGVGGADAPAPPPAEAAAAAAPAPAKAAATPAASGEAAPPPVASGESARPGPAPAEEGAQPPVDPAPPEVPADPPSEAEPPVADEIEVPAPAAAPPAPPPAAAAPVQVAEGRAPVPEAAIPEPASAPASPIAAPEPKPESAAAPVQAPPPLLEPAVLSAVAPPTVKRPGKVLVDLRGTGLHPQHRAQVLPVKKVPWGITVVRQKHVSETLITVLLQLDETAEPGEYAIAVEDGRGNRSEPLVFTVTR